MRGIVATTADDRPVVDAWSVPESVTQHDQSVSLYILPIPLSPQQGLLTRRDSNLVS